MAVLFALASVAHSFAPRVCKRVIDFMHYSTILSSSAPRKDQINDFSVWKLPFSNIKVFSSRNKNINEKKIEKISTQNDYMRLVANERESVVVVYFSAFWCKACKHTKPELYRLARQLSLKYKVKFVEVSMTKESAILYRALNVPTVPFGHIYHPDIGLVEELSVSKKNFRAFEAVLNSYLIGACGLDDAGIFDEPKSS